MISLLLSVSGLIPNFVVRLDELAWVGYQQKEKKMKARQHILAVTHQKTQLAVGKGTLIWKLDIFGHFWTPLMFTPEVSTI